MPEGEAWVYRAQQLWLHMELHPHIQQYSILALWTVKLEAVIPPMNIMGTIHMDAS